ncbi:MAG: outer membrane beta-barrel protein [Rhodobacteraceae bacterium]|nr:outer membrane beta-barrel protein [Paracoccaceae bacterium]
MVRHFRFVLAVALGGLAPMATLAQSRAGGDNYVYVGISHAAHEFDYSETPYFSDVTTTGSGAGEAFGLYGGALGFFPMPETGNQVRLAMGVELQYTPNALSFDSGSNAYFGPEVALLFRLGVEWRNILLYASLGEGMADARGASESYLVSGGFRAVGLEYNLPGGLSARVEAASHSYSNSQNMFLCIFCTPPPDLRVSGERVTAGLSYRF